MKKLEKYRGSTEQIHLVYAYLMHDHKTCYVGRTKELHKRDLSHRRGRKHKNGTITYDGLYTFCYNNNIEIPEPFVLEEKLNGLESLEREDFWVNYYRDCGWKILNKARTGIKSGSLGHIKIWDYKSCKKESSRYKTRTELKKNSYGCYDVCLKMGWLNEFFPILGKHRDGHWLKKENVLEESKKYKNITDFVYGSGGAYSAAKKMGWLDDLPFEKKIPKELSFSEIWGHYQEVGDVRKTIKEFQTSYKRIKNLFEENGVSIGNHKRKDPPPEEIPIIVELFENGTSGREIERRFNVTRKRIAKIVKAYYEEQEKTQ